MLNSILNFLHKHSVLFGMVVLGIPFTLMIQLAIHGTLNFKFKKDDPILAPASEVAEPGPDASCADIVTHAEDVQCRTSSAIRRQGCLRKMDRMFAECMAVRHPNNVEAE